MTWRLILQSIARGMAAVRGDSMGDAFRKALSFTLQWEGGFIHHPADPGGATNKGVTQRVYDAYRKGDGHAPRSVKLITDPEVAEIYRDMYWRAVRGADLPPRLAVAAFDWAVNTGPDRAIKHLQQCLGIKADGIIGPVTLGKAWEDEAKALGCYLAKREAFYRRVGTGKRSVFLKGWLNRLAALREFLNTQK